MTQTNHQPWTCGVCFWLFACDSEFVQLSCLWQRVTPEFDIVTAGKGMMTFHLRNVTAVSSNCKLTTTIINSPYFLFLASPLLSPWRIYASCLTCTGRPCPAPTRWVTWLNVKLEAFQMWQVYSGNIKSSQITSKLLEPVDIKRLNRKTKENRWKFILVVVSLHAVTAHSRYVS